MKLYTWHKIENITTESLPENKLTEVVVGEKRVGLLKRNNVIMAFTALCPHASANLCEGWLDAMGRIVCPEHKYRFDPANGRNTTGEGYKLFTYPVEIKGDEVYVGFFLVLSNNCSHHFMIQPPFLKAGSIIGITCPSSYIAPEKVTTCIAVLERWGFHIKTGNTIGTNHHYFSGTDEERITDLQAMLDDPAVDAILMGRGGYGMVRIIDDLDFTHFKNKPKWICGFSDITVLHNHVEQNFGIASLHSPMCGAFKSETENEAYLKTFYATITGESVYYHTPHSPFNRKGEAHASLTGGNLSLLAHIMGSPSEIDTTGKILFIEDIEEYLYKMDRMLLTLKRAGKFDNLKGLVVGYMTNMLDTDRPFGQTIEEIIWDKVKEYDYPVCFNFQCGHEDINYTLTLGAMHTLKVTASGGVLELKRVL